MNDATDFASCNLEDGSCGPSLGPVSDVVASASRASRPRVTYITDPICSACWIMEPAWRKLLHHHGRGLDVTYVIGGLLPGWTGFSDPGAGIRGPADVAEHWDDFARRSGQAIDSSVWRKDPLSSSYPAGIAAAGARLVATSHTENSPAEAAPSGAALADAYLRRLRELVFLDARNIAREDVLLDAARDVGVPQDALRAVLRNGVAEAEFRRDLDLAAQLGARGFPTIIFEGNGQQITLHGAQAYRQLLRALHLVSDHVEAEGTPGVDEALAVYRSGTSREFAELLNVETEEAEAMLENTGARRRSVGRSAVWSI